ncbi:IS110 family transposase, partial [Streptomyces sp. NPDC054775]
MNTNAQHTSGHVVIGVDTHKHVHVAAVMDTIGGILATLTIPTDTGGFRQLLDWASLVRQRPGVRDRGDRLLRRHLGLVPSPGRAQGGRGRPPGPAT